MRTLTRPRLALPDKKQLSIAALVIMLLLFAALSGAVVALGSKLLLVPIFFVIGLLAFTLTPARYSMWALALVCMVFEGVAIYFLEIELMRWFPPIFALAMALPLVLMAMQHRRDADALQGTPPFVIWLALFLISLLFSTLISAPVFFAEILTSWRDYLAYWPVMLLLFIGVLHAPQLQAMWVLLLLISLLQFPVALYQHFFVASQSLRSASWDAVVGTFPGSAEGGGASAAMATFVLIAIITAVALWQRGQLRTWFALLIGVCGLGTMLLAEVKAAVLMVPVGIAILYWRHILRQPLQMIVMLVAAIAAVMVIFTAYTQMYYGYDPDAALAKYKPESPVEAVMNQLDPGRYGRSGSDLSRAALLKDWWDRNPAKGDIAHALFGYGAGATQVSRLGLGELMGQFRYYLDRLSSSLLLWEGGLLAHGFFLLMLYSAARTATRLSTAGIVPVAHQALLRASSVALFILILTLPYKNFIFKTPPSQFLLVFLLGFIGYWYRRNQAALAANQRQSA